MAAAATRLTASERSLADARDAHAEAETLARTAGAEIGRSRARLEELRASAGYQAHQDLARLAGLVKELENVAVGARTRHADASEARKRADADAVKAAGSVAELRAEATRTARDVADEASSAGISWSAADAGEDGLATRAAARRTQRDADLTEGGAAAQRLDRAERDRRSASAAFDDAETAAGTAATAERVAGEGVAAARVAARQRLAAWAGRHAPVVDDEPGLLDALAATIDDAGEADAADPRAVFADLISGRVEALRDGLAGLRRERTARATDRTELTEQRERIAAERDDAPRVTATERELDAMSAAAKDLPKLGEVVVAVRVLAEAAGALRTARAAVDTARGRLDGAIAEVGARERELRRVEAERRRPAARLTEVAAAAGRFTRAADRLADVYVRGGIADLAATDAADRLADIADATTALTAAEDQVEKAGEAREIAIGRSAGAGAEHVAADEQLRVARVEEQATARELEPFAEDDVLGLLRCPAGLRWPARTDDWPDPATGGELPTEVVALHEAVLGATGELRPTEATVKQASTRLSRALDELTAELSAAGHDHRPEWDGASKVVLVTVVEESGPVPIGAFAHLVLRALALRAGLDPPANAEERRAVGQRGRGRRR